MKNHMSKRILSSILAVLVALSGVSVYAVPGMVRARQELSALVTEAAEMIGDYRNTGGQAMPAIADVSHGQLYSFVEDSIPAAHSQLSQEQRRDLYTIAQLFDTAFTLNDRTAREKAIAALYKRLQECISQVSGESLGGEGERLAAGPSKKLSKQKRKELLWETVGQERTNKPTAPQPQAVKDQAPGIEQEGDGDGVLQWVLDNKQLVITGLATVYSLLARYNDWPPFNKPEAQAANSQPAQVNAPAATAQGWLPSTIKALKNWFNGSASAQPSAHENSPAAAPQAAAAAGNPGNGAPQSSSAQGEESDLL